MRNLKLLEKVLCNLTQGDFVEAALGATETVETSLGTITIPTAGVKRIVGIWGIAEVPATTAEIPTGYFRLAFKTIPGVFKFPATTFAVGTGTLVGPSAALAAQIIPVDIPIPANESVTCTLALNVAATGSCRGMVGLLFE
jgi:hypothetical protein